VFQLCIVLKKARSVESNRTFIYLPIRFFSWIANNIYDYTQDTIWQEIQYQDIFSDKHENIY